MKTKTNIPNKISKQCKTARTLGIIGISTSIIGAGLIVSIVALVFACMGRKKAKNTQDKAKADLGFKLSIAGIVIGTIMVAIFTVGWIHVTNYIWNHVVW